MSAFSAAAAVALCHFCDHHGPVIVLATQTSRLERLDEHLQESSARLCREDAKWCDSCHCFQNTTRFLVTEDDISGDAYLSSNHGDLTCFSLFSNLRSAAVKSLSLEVLSNGDSMIFRQSGDGSFVLCSAPFEVKDANHFRGFVRKYGFILSLGRGKSLLLRMTSRVVAIFDELANKVMQPLAMGNFEEARRHGQQHQQRPIIDWSKRKPIYPPLRNLSKFTDTNIYAVIHYKFIEVLQLVVSYTASEMKEDVTLCPKASFELSPAIMYMLKSGRIQRIEFGLVLDNVLTGRNVQVRGMEALEVRALGEALGGILAIVTASSSGRSKVWTHPKWVQSETGCVCELSGHRGETSVFIVDLEKLRQDADVAATINLSRMVRDILEMLYCQKMILGLSGVVEVIERWRSLARMYARCLDRKHMDKETFRKISHLKEKDMAVLDAFSCNK